MSADWHAVNQRYLTAEVARVRRALARHVGAAEDDGEPPPDLRGLSEPPALDVLCASFELSPFERDVLLLCTGVELDSAFAELCGRPTFSLALAALQDAHWSAMTPAAPLRRWRLIECGSGPALTTAALRIDERVLHYLAGVPYLDERLCDLIEPVAVPAEVLPSQRALARRIQALWLWAEEARAARPVIQICGAESTGRRAAAALACAQLGQQLYAVRAVDVPAARVEREAVLRLWEREARLLGSALLVECDEGAEKGAERGAVALVEAAEERVLVSARDPIEVTRRHVIRVDVGKPSAEEQRSVWKRALAPLLPKPPSLEAEIDTLVNRFDLEAPAILTAGAEGLARLADSGDSHPSHGVGHGIGLGDALWDACRTQTRRRLDDLAQRIDATATWDDLVLPAAERAVLREITVHVRHRSQVYDGWGFGEKSRRGLGISALFAGPSGTGKTMAAEVLADELRLDLYRIDLSQVVSKYIGETEKNLRRVFDAAESGGAILLFDEADALFGKRSEVKDSHDRYANIEVSYLLQRMEAYGGLAILTTNMKQALDGAFLRRIRFVVQFPFPDAALRTEIWRRTFPGATPTEDLDLRRLGRLNVTGGSIRNIALNASFLAADAGEPVRMRHLLRAARGEYAKMEKAPTEAEIGGWV